MKSVRYCAVFAAAFVLAAVPQADASKPTRVSNSQQYKVSEGATATGRSGNATLAARALRGKDGAVQLEVTTGALDSAAVAPGNITKLQVKSFDGTGEVLVMTRNYTGLTAGGTASYTYSDLERGQPFQVQANIKGIDRNRTDVVTVSGNVRLRPDVAATRISAPARAPQGTPVIITASVEELNGEVGARTHCVLSVNGTAVDEANGIWVDAGGLVSCAFTHRFATAGVHALGVSLQSVVPADYDAANNSASTSIEIVPPGIGMQFSAAADDRVFDFGGTSQGYYQLADGTFATEPDWVNSWAGAGWAQNARMVAWVDQALPFPFAALRVRMATAGNTFHALELTNVSADWFTELGGGQREWCAARYDGQTSTHLYVCVNDSASRTLVDYIRAAGQAIYWSRNYGTHWYGGHSDYEWTWNVGTPVPHGPDYTIRVELVSGADTYLANATIPLSPVGHTVNNPQRCWDAWTGSERPGRQCQVDHDYLTGSTGSLSNP